jgi:hypothetical protein
MEPGRQQAMRSDKRDGDATLRGALRSTHIIEPKHLKCQLGRLLQDTPNSDPPARPLVLSVSPTNSHTNCNYMSDSPIKLPMKYSASLAARMYSLWGRGSISA